jgi:hypothetical protein
MLGQPRVAFAARAHGRLADLAIIIMVGTEEALRRGSGERALTTVEAQTVLRLRDRAFRELMNRGEITPYEERLGNYQLFLARDVEELRQQRLKRF